MLARPIAITRASGSCYSPILRTNVSSVRSSYRLSSGRFHKAPLENFTEQTFSLHTCRQQVGPSPNSHLCAGLSLTVPVTAGLACIAIAAYYFRPATPANGVVREEEELAKEVEVEVESYFTMSGKALPGRPGNLTPEQEEKLRQLWTRVFEVCGIAVGDEGVSDVAAVNDNEEPGKPGKKKKRHIFSRKGKKDAGDGDSTSSAPATSLKEGEDDKYGHIKQFHETLASQSPEDIRATIWSMLKHDHPDALVLRFLRARKWDVEKALVMLVSTMNWRSREMHVDDEIIMQGEGGAVAIEHGTDEKSKVAHDFMAQIRMGKSFLHGVDKDGRPICIVRVRLHKQGQELEESLERYTVYIIETARMMLQNGVDTATIVFDMTNFSMANMDYTPVKFMIKCFEANYPESLGAVLVHKAPWIFQGIWRVIKGWLDPVVAGKVHFTNSMKDVEEFIPRNHIIKELEGEEDWEYKYVEPIPGENDKMKDTTARDRLLAEREQLYRDFEQATVQWIREPNGGAKAQREDVAEKLRIGYWVLDPYLRARSLYDRTGIIKEGGKLDYYPEKATSAPVESVAPAHSADDVD